MKRFVKVLCVVSVLIYFTFGASSFAQEEEQGFMKRMWRKVSDEKAGKEEIIKQQQQRPVPQPQQQVKPAGEVKITKEERAERTEAIKDAIDTYGEELTSRLPNISTKLDREGNVLELYVKKSGKMVSVDELSDEEFVELFRTVATQITQMLAEKINEQQQMLQQMQQQLNIQRQQQQMQQIQQQIQQAPRIPQPVQPPQLPQLPPAPPQLPQIHIPPSTQVPVGPPNIPNIPSGPPPGPPPAPAHR